MKRKINSILIVVLFLVTLFFPPITASALLGSLWPVDPYGGRSLFTFPCTCSLCMWVLVGPPRPASVFYCPGETTLYKYYNIFPFAWQLGNKGMPTTCEWYDPETEECVTIGIGQPMLINGTSLY